MMLKSKCRREHAVAALDLKRIGQADDGFG
jgi:hypothetical protein